MKPRPSFLLWLLIGAFLAVNGLLKATSFDDFVQAVDNYRLLPQGWSPPVAAVVVALEMAVGLGLLTGRSRRATAFAAIAMLLFFSLLISASVLNGLDIDCGCSVGLLGASKVGWTLVLRNLVLAAILFVALTRHLGPDWRRDPVVQLFSTRFSGLVGLTFAGMLAQTVYLTQQNHLLRAKVTSSAPRMLREGDRVPAFSARALDGTGPLLVDYTGGDTLLFVFSATCPHCIASVPRWNEELEEDAAAHVMGISVSTEDETRRFVQERGARFPVYLPVNTSGFVADYRAYAVPQTLLVASGGEVRSNRVGRQRLEQPPGEADAEAGPVPR